MYFGLLCGQQTVFILRVCYETFPFLPSAIQLGRQPQDLFKRDSVDHCLGGDGPILPLQRYMAAPHQYVDHDHYLPDGVSDSKHPEP